jgi:Putative addiction module component
MQIEALEHQVLNLPPKDRSRMLELLITSLDEDEEQQQAWFAEASRRKVEADSGSATMLPGPETLAKLQAKFA